jgi:hypothetical protein
MSDISLLTASPSPYQASGSAPVAAPTVASSGPTARVDQDRDEHPRRRENTLVNAMMAAFQALGFGPGAATSTPASGAATPAPVPAASSTGSTSTASGTTPATDPAAATDTLESAVREFAHALFNALHDSARSQPGHRHGQESASSSAQASEHGSRRNHGYDSFVQRLEALAQSLGAPAPTQVAGAAPGASTASTAVALTTPPVTGTSPAPGASAVPASTTAQSPSRLLSAFSKLFDLLQPKSSGTPASSPANTVAEQLKLFLHTLAQALHGAPASAAPSSTGSLLNVHA